MVQKRSQQVSSENSAAGCCCGALIWFGALWGMLAMEGFVVCQDEVYVEAEATAFSIPCDAKNADYRSGDLVQFACNVSQNSQKLDFTTPDALCGGVASQSLLQTVAAHPPVYGFQLKLEMLQCIEYSCHTRHHTCDYGDDGENRRLNYLNNFGCDFKHFYGSKQCCHWCGDTSHECSYKIDWSESIKQIHHGSECENEDEFQRKCGSIYNTAAAGLPLGTCESYTDTFYAGDYKLGRSLYAGNDGLKLEVPMHTEGNSQWVSVGSGVTVYPRDASFSLSQPSLAMEKTKSNLGRVRATFKRDENPELVSVMGQINGHEGASYGEGESPVTVNEETVDGPWWPPNCDGFKIGVFEEGVHSLQSMFNLLHNEKKEENHILYRVLIGFAVWFGATTLLWASASFGNLADALSHQLMIISWFFAAGSCCLAIGIARMALDAESGAYWLGGTAAAAFITVCMCCCNIRMERKERAMALDMSAPPAAASV